MRNKLPLILAVLGIALLGVGVAYPLITLVVDNTPPTWRIASDGQIGIFPRNGETYMEVDVIQARVDDPESGVGSVTAVVDGTSYTLSLTFGDEYNGVWQISIPSLSSGTHSMTLTAKNKAGLSTTYSATFTVYTQLQGKWYVAGQEITSTTQTIYTTSTTVAFKFVKTAGIEDSKITCTVTEGTTTLLTLTNTAAGTWEGTYTFTAGIHTITLKAHDGTTAITFSIVNLEFPGAPSPIPIPITPQQTFIIIGVICLASAGLLKAGIIKRH